MAVIYLDTVVCVLAVENADEDGDKVRELIGGSAQGFCASPLVLMECLVKPFRTCDLVLETGVRDFLATLRMVDVTRRMWEEAARLRAAKRLGAADSLHLAIAQLGGCSALWTADADLAKRSGGFARDILSLPAAP
ncbi:MAG: type II toxin-antitoxin system VapC family toxin [Bifidobacteriaceae bacterium]|nr:type II toxin-antitoxin system VapC family toxin [Bifidobacteriaceae bacterium]